MCRLPGQYFCDLGEHNLFAVNIVKFQPDRRQSTATGRFHWATE